MQRLFQPGTVNTAEEAANIYVATYPAVPWDDIADKLEPKHNITADAARAMAAVTTQAQISQFLSTFSIGLGIGLPARAETQTTTVTDGVEQTTSTRTRGTGAVPPTSGQPSSAISEGALAPDLSKPPAGLALDASTLLTVGTGVYQLAQILDNQITKAFYPHGYDAHLLTFQVALQPKARTLPYDVYINLSLHPAQWEQALDAANGVKSRQDVLPPLLVYPLVISDAMETSSTARSVEVIRQAALQLSGVVGRLGVNAGLGAGTDALDAVIGQIRNSIVTVGRVSDHALRIRLGAQHSGESRYAMVPRTHNISVVVLRRWPDGETAAEKAKRVTHITVITETEIVPVEGGERLRGSGARVREALADRVRERVETLRFAVLPECAAATDKDPNQPVERYLELLRAVDRQDYQRVSECLAYVDDKPGKGKPKKGDAVGRALDLHDHLRLERLLAELIQIQANSRHSKMLIPLKERAVPKLPPPDQVVAAVDDPKAGLAVTLRGGKGLRGDALSAELALLNGRKLLPKAINVAQGGAEIVATFPSLQELGLQQHVAGSKALKLVYSLNPAAPLREDYALHTPPAKKPEPPKGAKNPVSVSQEFLIPDRNGVARLTLTVGEIPKEVAGPIRVVVKGADVREDTAPGSAKLTAEGVVVAEKSVARIALGNLAATRGVTITTVAKDAKTKKKDVTLGEPITLHLAR